MYSTATAIGFGHEHCLAIKRNVKGSKSHLPSVELLTVKFVKVTLPPTLCQMNKLGSLLG